jgi:hypothetical protein
MACFSNNPTDFYTVNDGGLSGGVQFTKCGASRSADLFGVIVLICGVVGLAMYLFAYGKKSTWMTLLLTGGAIVAGTVVGGILAYKLGGSFGGSSASSTYNGMIQEWKDQHSLYGNNFLNFKKNYDRRLALNAQQQSANAMTALAFSNIA